MSMRAAVVSEQSESKTTEKKGKKFGLEQFSSYENNNSSRTRTRTQQVSLQTYYSSSATAPDTTHSKTVEEEQQQQGQEELEELDEGLTVPVQASSCSPVDSLQVILSIVGSSLQFCWFFFCGMIWISFRFWMPRKQSLICLVVEMALMKGRKRVWSATACGGRACWGPVSPDFQGSCCFRVNFCFFPFLSFNFFFLVSENHLLL